MVWKIRRGGYTGTEKAKGEAVISHKLTAEDVIRAREDYKNLPNFHELARKYKVARNTIRSAIRNETWKHIGGASLNGENIRL